jgi:ketosteroid isomerase-like protein
MSAVSSVREAIDAFNRHDKERFLELAADVRELVPLRAALEDTVFTGPGAAERFWHASEEAWSDLQVAADELREVGDKVLVLGRLRGIGRATGAAVDVRCALLFDVPGGRITRMVTYPDPRDALAVLGLSE